jgi:hypothetical protein
VPGGEFRQPSLDPVRIDVQPPRPGSSAICHYVTPPSAYYP